MIQLIGFNDTHRAMNILIFGVGYAMLEGYIVETPNFVKWLTNLMM